MFSEKKILCAMPMYLYGDSNRGYSNEYNGIYKTLLKKFKNVIFFDTYDKTRKIYDTNIKLIELSRKFLPNLIFTSIATYEIYFETLKKIKKICGAKIINWSSDDSWRYDQHTKLIAPGFDVLITTYKSAHKKNLDFGKNSILSNWGCPDDWVKNVTPSKDCKTDVLFIGNSYMGRKKIIKKLIDKGIKVICFGYGWHNPPVKDSEIAQYINKAKITLNFSKSRGSMKQTKARIFEIMGAGGFCLTETSNEVSDFFVLDKEIVTFKNFQELLEKAKYFLKNNFDRDEIAIKGNYRCNLNYTTSKIMEKILYQLENIQSLSSHSESASDIVNEEKLPLFLILYKKISIFFLKLFIEENKSIKISRRILFEIEWRLRKEKTYSSKGWCSNLFNYL